MISPKEKAQELIGKFYKYSRQDSSGFLVSNEDMYIKNAKQCAIICVDEILNNFGTLVDGKDHYCAYFTTQFYEEVRKELGLL